MNQHKVPKYQAFVLNVPCDVMKDQRGVLYAATRMYQSTRTHGKREETSAFVVKAPS